MIVGIGNYFKSIMHIGMKKNDPTLCRKCDAFFLVSGTEFCLPTIVVSVDHEEEENKEDVGDEFQRRIAGKDAITASKACQILFFRHYRKKNFLPPIVQRTKLNNDRKYQNSHLTSSDEEREAATCSDEAKSHVSIDVDSFACRCTAALEYFFNGKE
jgi:hypothetical protein